MKKYDLDNVPLCMEQGHRWEESGRCERCGLMMWDVSGDFGLPMKRPEHYGHDYEINSLEDLDTQLPDLSRFNHILVRVPLSWPRAMGPVYEIAKKHNHRVAAAQESHGGWSVFHLFPK